MTVNSYYDISKISFRNTKYALDTALLKYLAKIYFNGDESRIIYCSNEFALQKRSKNQPWNNANLPFLNFKSTGISKGGERQWFSMSGYAEKNGIWIKELNRKIMLLPVSFEYECTLYFGQDIDYLVASRAILDDSTSETKVDYILNIDGHDVDNLAIITTEEDLNPQWAEKDWLEKNHIWAPSMNFKAQTFWIKDSSIIYPTESITIGMGYKNSDDAIAEFYKNDVTIL